LASSLSAIAPTHRQTEPIMPQQLFGKLNRCPICKSMLSADDSALWGSTSCPRCQAPLWFVHFEEAGTRFMVKRDQLFKAALAQLIDPGSADLLECFFDEINTDSLDRMELLMEIEKALPAMPD